MNIKVRKFFTLLLTIMLLLTSFLSYCRPALAYTVDELTNEQKAFVDEYIMLAIELGAEFSIPCDASMAIAIVESGWGTSWRAIHKRNFHGMEVGRTYATPEEGWRGFHRLIAEQGNYAAKGALDHIDDPYGFLAAILDADYNPNPEKYTADIGEYIYKVQEYRLHLGLPDSAQYRKMQKNPLDFQPETEVQAEMSLMFDDVSSDEIEQEVAETAETPMY